MLMLRLQRSLSIYKRQSILLNSALSIHTSNFQCKTHDYQVLRFSLPRQHVKTLIDNPSLFKTIGEKIGVVARFTQDNVELEEGGTELLLVGLKENLEKVRNFFQSNNLKPFFNEYTDTRSNLIWQGYRRNFKGQFPPIKPRKKCIRCGGKMLSGNPCPLCQLQIESDYKIHYTDVALLKQFICPHTLKILSHDITGLCRDQKRRVDDAINKARLYGHLPFTLPLPEHVMIRPHVPAGMPKDRNVKVKMH